MGCNCKPLNSKPDHTLCEIAIVLLLISLYCAFLEMTPTRSCYYRSPTKFQEGNVFSCCVCLFMYVCLSVCSPRGLHVTIIKDAIGQSQVRRRLPLAPTPLASTTQGPQACSYLFNLDFTTEGASTSLLQKNIQTCSPCSPDGGQADGLHSTEMFLFGYADGSKWKQLSLTEFHI